MHEQVSLTWQEFLKILREEAGSPVVETWFKAANLVAWSPEKNVATISVPNNFVRSWIQDHYLELIARHLGRLLHTRDVTCLLVLTAESALPSSKSPHEQPFGTIIPASSLASPIPLPAELITTVPAGHSSSRALRKTSKTHFSSLNELYIFDSFVVGPSNSLGHAAAYAVSQNPGKVYNPLFVYGGTGLGKTHLMHAIGNEVRARKPEATIYYVTSDCFTNEFINSIRFDKNNQFREKYQRADLLMIDDVQFLSNKEQTQEAFFHIFNRLYERGKQIVLSSDTFPKEISGLQNRLKSRLEWGLVVDIQIPDLETKIAILRRKAEKHHMILSEEVATFIAARVISNIRELEGALIRMSAFSALTNESITIDLARRVLSHLTPKKKEGIMLSSVLKAVADHYAINTADIKAHKRHKDIATIRQVALYLMKKHTPCSLQAIGEFVGGRDHSTVIHAVTKIESLLETDPVLAAKVRTIEQAIHGV